MIERKHSVRRVDTRELQPSTVRASDPKPEAERKRYPRTHYLRAGSPHLDAAIEDDMAALFARIKSEARERVDKLLLEQAQKEEADASEVHVDRDISGRIELPQDTLEETTTAEATDCAA